MEDNIQTIITIIISAFILFIFPVYMAYEKKDDISYALAMRYTQEFVDEVRSKGYITKTMYEDYKGKLKVTGNSYDITLTHEYNRYDPIVNYYTLEDNKYVFLRSVTSEQHQETEQVFKVAGISNNKLSSNPSKEQVQAYLNEIYLNNNIHKVEKTYKLSTEVYSTDYILNVLNSERKLLLNADSSSVTCSDDDSIEDGCQYAYTMNVGDNFNITIKNTNITLATVIYNMVTANTLDSNTRIYVNYGGAIISTKWYGDVDYAKMKHDGLDVINKSEQVVFTEERHYYTSELGTNYPTATINPIENQPEKYVIEFEAKPEVTTELREKGEVPLDDYSGYNFAIGHTSSSIAQNNLSVSVGLNGISLLVNNYLIETSAREVYLPYYDQIIIDQDGNEQINTVQRNITDYNKIEVFWADNKLNVKLNGKANVEDINEKYTVSRGDMWEKINTQITNLTWGMHNAGTSISKGIERKYVMTIYDNKVKVVSTTKQSGCQTILSYPMNINSYAKIRIEFLKQQDNSYIGMLYINNVKVGETIKINSLPKVDIVGEANINAQKNYFSGYIRNVKIYEVGD